MRVIDADFSLATGVRPAVVVFGFALLMTLAAAVRGWMLPARGRPRFA